MTSETIPYLQTIVAHAMTHGGWTVGVYPTPEKALEAAGLLAGALPSGSWSAGRTALLPNGGKISVVSADVQPFTTPYAVAFLGWRQPGKEYLGMAAWRAKAAKVFGE